MFLYLKNKKRLTCLLVNAFLIVVFLTGCSSILPHNGPGIASFHEFSKEAMPNGIELITVNYPIAAYLKNKANHPNPNLLSYFTTQNPKPALFAIGVGDMLEVYIWEAPPSLLFSPSSASTISTAMGPTMTTIPSQIVDNFGNINVPFANKIHCSGKTLSQIAKEIRKKLIKKAHDPQVVVKLVKNRTRNVSVLGNVKNSLQVPLLPGGVTVLQALAAAGGVDRAIDQTTIQIERKGRALQLPLKTVIRNPEDNVLLHPGDVVTALYQPLHLTIMGSTAQTKEIDFKSSGINLTEALAKAGGIDGSRADAKDVFLFRFEDPTLFSHWPKAIQSNADGKVAVVYQFDFSRPSTLFAAETFPVEGNDLIYVASAPATDFQKFLGLITQMVSPARGF